MKTFPSRIILCLALSGALPSPASADLAVDLDVQVAPTAQVGVNWTSDKDGEIWIKRRELGRTGFDNWDVIAKIGTDDSPYRDSDVSLGLAYEYRVELHENGDPVSSRVNNVVATLETPLGDARGAVLLVVEDTWITELSGNLANLEMDLVGDGWEVVRLDWQRYGPGTYEPGGGEALKSAIVQAVADNPDINSLFLFGAVPVVYSGSDGPDGHGGRPHETDLFYADLEDTWTDTKTHGGIEPNVPGDGIYDQSATPTPPELATGRVTFHSMPTSKKSEVEYLRDYIHKAFAYRHTHRIVPYRGALGDEAFCSHTNDQLRGLFGDDGWVRGTSVINDLIEDESYLMWVGAGIDPDAEKYELGRENFQKAMFTFPFRSYMQQYWTRDNAMRTLMAQPDWGLTATWGSRPIKYFHQMAAGGTVGESILIAQRNLQDYNHYANSYRVSTNLLGDPTLRFAHVAPASNPSVARPVDGQSQLSWTASTSANLVGYHVYRSAERLGPYTKLTADPISVTDYLVDVEPGSDNWFQVRAIAKVTVPTGVYIEQSQGVFALVKADGSVNHPPVASDLTVNGKVNTLLNFTFPGSDVDGDALTPIVIDNPDEGQIRWFAGQPYYVTDNELVGAETATFVMFDGVTVSEPATITFIADTAGDTLIAWDMADGASTPPASIYNHTKIAPASIVMGSGVRVGTAWGRKDCMLIGNLGKAFNLNKYASWTVTPTGGSTASLQQLLIALNGEAGQEFSYELRASINNFATYDVIPLSPGSSIHAVGYGRNQGALHSVDLTAFAELQDQSLPIEFRLYPWRSDGASSGAMGIGGITDIDTSEDYVDAIEDLAVIGTVSPPATTFEFWAESVGLTPGENDSWDDAPTGNGKSNLESFAFDSNPFSQSPVTEKIRSRGTVDGDSSYMSITLPVRNGAMFSGAPPKSEPIDGLTYEIIGSDIPGPGGSMLLVEEMTPALASGMPALSDYDGMNGPDWEYRTFRLATPLDELERGFIVIKIETENP